MGFLNVARGWLRSWRAVVPQAASALAEQTPGAEVAPPPQEVPAGWQQFLALGVGRDDLLDVLEDYPFEPRLREAAGHTLLQLYGSDLTLEELDSIIRGSAGPSVVEAARLVMQRATTKEELAQVLISVPEFQVEAARRTLELNPELYDLARCMEVPAVAEQAFEMLMARNPPRSRLRHMIGYDEKFGPRVQQYLDERGRRFAPTDAMRASLLSMAECSHTRH